VQEADSVALGAGTSAEKSASGSGRVRRFTRTRKPFAWSGYNEHMALIRRA
jgi:hypothetical protein